MTPKTLMSVEEFTALPGDGMLHELNEGELISMPPPRPRHGSCQVAIAAALREFATARDRGMVYVESGYRLTPHTLRGPDVSFVRKSRLQDPDEYFNGAPDLAIEIVSPGDDASDLREKVKKIDTKICPLYLLTGEYDFSCTPEDTLRTAQQIPGVEVTIMKEVGHFPMSENPAQFRKYILHLLNKISLDRGIPARS